MSSAQETLHSLTTVLNKHAPLCRWIGLNDPWVLFKTKGLNGVAETLKQGCLRPFEMVIEWHGSVSPRNKCIWAQVSRPVSSQPWTCANLEKTGGGGLKGRESHRGSKGYMSRTLKLRRKL